MSKEQETAGDSPITTLEQALPALGMTRLSTGDIALNLARIDQIDPQTGHIAEEKISRHDLITLSEVEEMLEVLPLTMETVRKFYSPGEAAVVVSDMEQSQQAYRVIRDYLAARQGA